MYQLKTYTLTMTPDCNVNLTIWALGDEPATSYVLYNGGQMALLYRRADAEPVVIDYIPRRFQPFLSQAKKISVTEINRDNQETVRLYHTDIKQVATLPPVHLNITKQDLVAYAVQNTTLKQQKAYLCYPLKDGGLLFMIAAQNDDPETPVIFYDGKDHCLLRHNARTTLVLDYLEPTLIPMMSRLEQVWICEFDFVCKKLIREYKVPLKRSNRLPEIKLEIEAETLATSLIKPTHQQKIYYFVCLEDEVHLFLLRHETPPENAAVLYDGGEHALLYRNADDGVILGFLPQEVRSILQEIKKITVHGCDFNTGSQTFVYQATVRHVSRLPPVSWDLTLSFI